MTRNMRRLILLACLACAPALASAQTVVVTESNDQDKIINIAECSNSPADRLAFVWSVAAAAPYDLYVSDQANCPAPGSTVNGVTTNAHTATVNTNIQQASYNQGDTASTLLSSVGIQCLGASATLFVCVFTSGTNTNPIATGSVPLDLVSPAAPVLVSVSGGDGSLTAVWTLGTGSADAGTTGSANNFTVTATPADGSPGQRSTTFTGAGTTSGRVTGLINGVLYNVTVTALTIGSNPSPPSNELPGTPVVVNDFWRLYQNAGGREQGGCGTGAAGLAALLALAPLLWRKRRSRS
jgi:hypothetical protein